MRENLERPVRFFSKALFSQAKCTFETFFTTCSEFSRSPFGCLLGPSGTNFTPIFTPIFTQISHNFHTLGWEASLGLFWARPGEATPSSQATSFAQISGPLLRPLGARLAKTREVPRIMRNPAHSHRLHGDLPKNGATDVAAASGASAKMYYYHCPPE